VQEGRDRVERNWRFADVLARRVSPVLGFERPLKVTLSPYSSWRIS